MKGKNKDENYIIDLCDEILKKESKRQYRFDFLVGDPGKNGRGRKLPVDAYYPELNLVIEYRERQHTEAVAHFDKPDKLTISGVHRGLQRTKYDQLRRDILPKNKIKLIEISYSDFEYDKTKRLIRNKDKIKTKLELILIS